VFYEVSVFQAGSIMAQAKTNENPKPLPAFVPIYPYLYKNIDFGGLIHDSNGHCDKIQLFLNGK